MGQSMELNPRGKQFFDRLIDQKVGVGIYGPLDESVHVTYSLGVSVKSIFGPRGIPKADIPKDLKNDKRRVTKGPSAQKAKQKEFYDFFKDMSYEFRKDLEKVCGRDAKSAISQGEFREFGILYREISTRIEAELNAVVSCQCSMLRELYKYSTVSQSYSFCFYEKLKSIFLAGGLPVGWQGEYPDGSFLVLWPHDQDPEFADVFSTL